MTTPYTDLAALVDAEVKRKAERDVSGRDVAPMVRLIRGDAVKLEPVRWLWRGFLPAGMLTILGGAPGCGKTTIALSLAAVITSGGTWPDGSRCESPGDVLLWSGEDAQPVLAARLAAAGANMSRVHFIDGVTDIDGGAFDPGRDMPLLEATAGQLAAPRMLILDPIVQAVAGDGHKSNDVRRALQPVVTLGQRLGCAVLGITHFSKGTSGRDPVERITGSLAFAALARMVLVAAKIKADDDESEPRRVLVKCKANDTSDEGGFAYQLERVLVAPEVEGQRVRWLEALEGTARDVLAEAEAEPENRDGDSDTGADAFLRGLLADGPVQAKVIKADADGAGYAWRTVQRAGNRIGAERRKDGLRGGWVWALPGSTEPRRRHEGAEDASLQSVASTAPSVASSAQPTNGAHGWQPRQFDASVTDVEAFE